MANTKIVLNRQSDLILDNALITNPQGIVLTDISGVSEAVASINSATSVAISSEASARAAAIDNEQSARVDGDQSLQNQIDFITSNVDAAAIDSLTEIVAAFQSADGDINGAITALASTATSGLSTEVARAESVEAIISSDLSAEISNRIADVDAEESRATSAELSLTADLSDFVGHISATEIDRTHSVKGIETAGGYDFFTDDARLETLSDCLIDTDRTRRENDNLIITRLINEENRAESVEAVISSDLSAEISNRGIAIDNEVSAREAGDVSVTAAMSAEISTRVVAETSLQNNIDAEASLRVADVDYEESRAVAAEGSLASNLDAEASRAISAELSLNTKVEFVISNTDAAALDSLTEIVAAFQSADGDINGAITSLALNAAVAIDAEASIRLAADQSISADLSSEIVDRAAAVSAEEVARISGDESIALDLSAEVEARISDVNAEQARAESAEAVLTADLSSEVINRSAAVSAEASLRVADVDAEESRATSAELVLTNALSAEISRAEFAEASIAEELSSEVSYIMANTDLTSIDSFAEVVADLSTEVARAESVEAEIAEIVGTNATYMLFELATERNTRDNADIAEASYRVAGDLSLQNQIDFITNNTDAAAIDSLTEIVAAFQSADGDINNAITNLADAAGANLSTEVATRTSADASIAAEVSISVSDRVAADESLAAEISSEIESLALTDETTIELNTADNTIKLKDTVAAPASGVRTFEGEVDVNSILRVAGVDVMAAMSTEVSDRIVGDLSLASDLSAEASLRSATVSTEVSNRAAAITAEASTRAAAIDNEQSARIDGDQSLQNQIDFITSNVAPEAIDSLTEIVAAFQTADGDLNGAITGLTATATANLSAEVARAESAEASLDAAKLDLAGGTMSGAIDMGNNNINSVERLTADSVFVNTIANPNGDYIIAFTDGRWKLYPNIDADGTAQIINLPAPTNDGDAANKLYVDSALSAEVSRAEAAEASIAEELSSEVSYIMANTDLTSIDSFAEVVADLSSEVVRAESAEASLALDFANIYAKHVALTQTANGVVTEFSLVDVVREGSELIYVNGLLLDSEDYTANITNGMVSSVTFFIAPSTGDKVRAYGVY